MTRVDRFAAIAAAIGNPIDFETAKILDVGCGSATTLIDERLKGRDVFGCDIADGLEFAPKDLIKEGIVKEIDIDDYRIPFDDKTFDMVVSHEVLEHVLNYDEVLREIRRTLKLGGISIHIFPSKYTPIEPHVYVPLATTIRSIHWLKLWAYLGIRNEYQRTISPGKVAEVNCQYLHAHTTYLKKSELLRVTRKYFSSVKFAEKEYLLAGAGYGPFLAKLPLVPRLFGAFVHRVMVIS